MKRENGKAVAPLAMSHESREIYRRLQVGMVVSLFIHAFLLTCIKVDLRSSVSTRQDKSIQIVVDKAEPLPSPRPSEKIPSPKPSRQVLPSAKVPRPLLPRRSEPPVMRPSLLHRTPMLPKEEQQDQPFMESNSVLLPREPEDANRQPAGSEEDHVAAAPESVIPKVTPLSPEQDGRDVEPLPRALQEVRSVPIYPSRIERAPLAPVPEARVELPNVEEEAGGESKGSTIVALRPEDAPSPAGNNLDQRPLKRQRPDSGPTGQHETPTLSSEPSPGTGAIQGLGGMPGINRRFDGRETNQALIQQREPSLTSGVWEEINTGRREGTEGLWEQIGQILWKRPAGEAGMRSLDRGKVGLGGGLQGIAGPTGERSGQPVSWPSREGSWGSPGVGKRGMDRAEAGKREKLPGAGTSTGFRSSEGVGRIRGEGGSFTDSLKFGWGGRVSGTGEREGTGRGFGKSRPEGGKGAGEGGSLSIPGWGNGIEGEGPGGKWGTGDWGGRGIRMARLGSMGHGGNGSAQGKGPGLGFGMQSSPGSGREGVGGLAQRDKGIPFLPGRGGEWGMGGRSGGIGHGKWGPGKVGSGAAEGGTITGLEETRIAGSWGAGGRGGSGPGGSGSQLAPRGNGTGRENGPGIGETGTGKGRAGQGVGYGLTGPGGLSLGRGKGLSGGIHPGTASKSRPGGLIAKAIGTFRMPTVRLSDWDDPGLIPNLLNEVSKRTQIKVSQDSKYEELKLSNIENTPLIYFTGHRSFKLSDDQRQVLRAYTQLGGTLLFENDHGPFAGSVMREMRKIFGESPKPIPLSDPIFQEMQYRIREIPRGDLQERKPLLGIKKDGRWVVIFSRNDYGDVYANRVPFIPESQRERVREEAFQIGINIYQYATAHWNALQESRQRGQVAAPPSSPPSETPKSGSGQEQEVPPQEKPSPGAEGQATSETLPLESP